MSIQSNCLSERVDNGLPRVQDSRQTDYIQEKGQTCGPDERNYERGVYDECDGERFHHSGSVAYVADRFYPPKSALSLTRSCNTIRAVPRGSNYAFLTPDPPMVYRRLDPAYRHTDLVYDDGDLPPSGAVPQYHHDIYKQHSPFLTPQAHVIRCDNDNLSFISERNLSIVPIQERSYIISRPRHYVREHMPSFDINDSQTMDDFEEDMNISSVSEYINKEHSGNTRKNNAVRSCSNGNVISPHDNRRLSLLPPKSNQCQAKSLTVQNVLEHDRSLISKRNVDVEEIVSNTANTRSVTADERTLIPAQDSRMCLVEKQTGNRLDACLSKDQYSGHPQQNTSKYGLITVQDKTLDHWHGLTAIENVDHRRQQVTKKFGDTDALNQYGIGGQRLKQMDIPLGMTNSPPRNLTPRRIKKLQLDNRAQGKEKEKCFSRDNDTDITHNPQERFLSASNTDSHDNDVSLADETDFSRHGLLENFESNRTESVPDFSPNQIIDEDDDDLEEIATLTEVPDNMDNINNSSTPDNLNNQDQSHNEDDTCSNNVEADTLPSHFPSRNSPEKLHNWIIKTVPEIKGICVEGRRSLSDEEFWRSAVIIKRVDNFLVESNTGSRHLLVGQIDMDDAECGGFDDVTISHFIDGFPKNWQSIVNNFYKASKSSKEDDTGDKLKATNEEKKENSHPKKMHASKQNKVKKKNSLKTKVKNKTESSRGMKEKETRHDVQSKTSNHKDAKKSYTMTNWIIKPVTACRGVCVEGKIRANMREGDYWHSSPIMKKIDTRTLLTASGTVYKLEGSIEKLETLNAGFTVEITNAFKTGFPDNWKILLEKYYLTKPIKSSEKAKTKNDTTLTDIPGNTVFTPVGQKLNSLQRTRSGRLSKPMVGWWMGQSLKVDEKTGAYSLEHRTEYACKVALEISEAYSTRYKVDKKKKNENDSVIGENTFFRGVENPHKHSSPVSKEEKDKTKDTAKRRSRIKENNKVIKDSQSESEMPGTRIKGNNKVIKDSQSESEMPGTRIKENNKVINNSREVSKTRVKENNKVIRDSKLSYEASKTKIKENIEGIKDSQYSNKVSRTKIKENNKVIKDSQFPVAISKSKVSDNNKVLKDSQPSNEKLKTKTIKNKLNSTTELNTNEQECQDLHKEIMEVVKESRISRIQPPRNKKTCYNQKEKVSKTECKDHYSVESSVSDEESVQDEKRRKTANSKYVQRETRSRKEESSKLQSLRKYSKDTHHKEIDTFSTCDKSFEGNLNEKGKTKTRKQCSTEEDRQKTGDENIMITQTSKTQQWKREEVIRFTRKLKTSNPDDVDFWEDLAKAVKTRTPQECQLYYYKDVPEHQRKLTMKRSCQAKNSDKVIELTARAGTLKRKQQLRDIMENANEGHEDDVFDSTPYRKYNGAKVPRLDEDEEDVFAVLAEQNKDLMNKIFTPLTRREIRPASTSKTPLSNLQIDTPVYNRKKVDQYTWQAQMKRRRLVKQTKKLKSPQDSTKSSKNLLSQKISVPKSTAEDAQSMFMTDYNSDENHADSEEEEDLYFSDH